MQSNRITISRLCQRYGRKPALQDISLDIGPRMTGLLGRNGAGKTTLMKTLVTLMPPAAGNIHICGIPVNQTRKVRSITGYLPQEFSMYPSMKVWEVLDYLGILSGLDKPTRSRRTEEILAAVNLTEERDKKVKALSGGMKRRLGVAQALLHDPVVIIADEPTVGLDPEERVRLRTLLVELAKEKIVILSTHIVEDIEAACENVAIIEEGRLLYAGEVKRLIAQTGADSMETAYLRSIQSREAK